VVGISNSDTYSGDSEYSVGGISNGSMAIQCADPKSRGTSRRGIIGGQTKDGIGGRFDKTGDTHSILRLMRLLNDL
jgi:hypothetical protein